MRSRNRLPAERWTMTSPSSPPPTPPDSPDAQMALDALDATISTLSPPPDGGGMGEAPRRRGRPKGARSRQSKEDPAAEPPSPALVDTYGAMGAGVAVVGFRIAGRVVGGAPEVWEVTDAERAELARALGPVLALHHNSIGQALPYAEPVLLLYAMFSQRYTVATEQVKAERERIGMPTEAEEEQGNT